MSVSHKIGPFLARKAASECHPIRSDQKPTKYCNVATSRSCRDVLDSIITRKVFVRLGYVAGVDAVVSVVFVVAVCNALVNTRSVVSGEWWDDAIFVAKCAAAVV